MLLFVVGAYFAIDMIVGGLGTGLKPFYAVLAGIIAGVLIGVESEYYTSGSPVKLVARSSETGPATTIITGLAVGFESTIMPIITLVILLALGAVIVFVAWQLSRIEMPSNQTIFEK